MDFNFYFELNNYVFIVDCETSTEKKMCCTITQQISISTEGVRTMGAKTYTGHEEG
jgi:prephenate dehydratase